MHTDHYSKNSSKYLEEVTRGLGLPTPEEEPSEFTDEEGNTYMRLDRLPSFDTSTCKHQWFADEELEGGMKHWVCLNPKCGRGKYQTNMPS